MQYPGIYRAAFLIALDNGGINRGRSKEQHARDVERFLATRVEPLREIDNWLQGLDDAELDEICCGDSESEEGIAVRERHPPPPFADSLLDDYFEEVC